MRSLLMAPLLVAGCAWGYIPVPSEPQEPIEDTGDYGADSDQVRYVLDNFKTAELGTEKTRPIAKTIEWPEISTVVGTTYVSGKAVVDMIMRRDSGNSYGVRVRLKNTTGVVQAMEYRFMFGTRKGSSLIPYIGVLGDEVHWTGFVLEAYQGTNVADFSRIIGAEGFTLFVRAQGGAGDGSPTAP